MGNGPSINKLQYAPLYEGVQMKPTVLKTKQTFSKGKQHHLLKTAYHGVWTMVFPKSVTPPPRVGHAWVYDSLNDKAYIAYGADNNGTCMNDAWVLDVKELKWSKINAQLLSPRCNVSCTMIGRKLFMFGGQNGTTFYGDLHCMDLDTYEVLTVELPGPKPKPRACPVFFSTQDALFLWGGISNQPHGAVHVLRAGTREWHKHEHGHTGRAYPAFTEFKGKYYIFGSSKGHGLLTFDPITKEFEAISCTGTEPKHDIEHAAICGADEYLFLVGGVSDTQYMHVFALDLTRNWWFAFHVRPDLVTVQESDGFVNKNGLFQLPREHSATIFYRERSRSLISFLGSKMMNPCPIFEISIGLPLAALHMRSDMYEILHKSMNGVAKD